jgi:hypothetical protein
MYVKSIYFYLRLQFQDLRSLYRYTQIVPGGKVSNLGGHSTGHSKQKSVKIRMPYSEWFPK